MELTIIPRFILNLFSDEAERRIHLSTLLTSVLLICTIATFPKILGLINSLPHICLFQYLLGIPCPGCGLLRSFEAISTMDIHSSLQFNPMGLPFVIFLVLQIPLRLIALISGSYARFVSALSSRLSYALASLLILFWSIKIIPSH